MNRFVLVAVMSLTVVSQWAFADCGGIPFEAKAAIFEPDQRAVIGFNGEEENCWFPTSASCKVVSPFTSASREMVLPLTATLSSARLGGGVLSTLRRSIRRRQPDRFYIRVGRMPVRHILHRLIEWHSLNPVKVGHHGAWGTVYASTAMHVDGVTSPQQSVQGLYRCRKFLPEFLGIKILHWNPTKLDATPTVRSFHLIPTDTPVSKIFVRLQVEHRRNADLRRQRADVCRVTGTGADEQVGKDLTNVHQAPSVAASPTG